jgi:hypothetical protein
MEMYLFRERHTLDVSRHVQVFGHLSNSSDISFLPQLTRMTHKQAQSESMACAVRTINKTEHCRMHDDNALPLSRKH